MDFAIFISKHKDLSKRKIFSLYAQNTSSDANNIRNFYYRNREEIDALVEKNTKVNMGDRLKEKAFSFKEKGEVKLKEKVEVGGAKSLSLRKILNFLKNLFPPRK